MVWFVVVVLFSNVLQQLFWFFFCHVINTMASSNFHSVVYNLSLREPKQKLKAETQNHRKRNILLACSACCIR